MFKVGRKFYLWDPYEGNFLLKPSREQRLHHPKLFLVFEQWFLERKTRFKSSFQRWAMDATFSFWMSAWDPHKPAALSMYLCDILKRNFLNCLRCGTGRGEIRVFSCIALKPVIWRRQGGSWTAHAIAGVRELIWHEAEGGRFYKKLLPCGSGFWCPNMHFLSLWRVLALSSRKPSPPDALIRSACCSHLYEPDPYVPCQCHSLARLASQPSQPFSPCSR